MSRKIVSKPDDAYACISIGVLPTAGCGQGAAVMGQAMASRLASTLSHIGAFSVLDYSREGKIDALPPDVMLLLHTSFSNDAYLLSLSLSCISSKKILWSDELTIASEPGAEEKFALVSVHLTDQIASVLVNPKVFKSSSRHKAAKYVLGAINDIFSLSSRNLDNAERALSLAIETEPKGIYYAWYAYLMAFRFEELKDGYEKDLKAKTLHLADIAISKDSNNPLVLALVAHVHAFIFRDFHRAQQLIEPAIAMGSNATVVLDSFALLKFYQGDLLTARKAAVRVYEGSLYSPYRYCYATSLCMIDTVMGNFDSAVLYGEQAIAMHPADQESIFAPTLRYLSVAQQESGNKDRANELFHTLGKQEPEFESTDILKSDYPMPSHEAALFLSKSLKGIERAGAAGTV